MWILLVQIVMKTMIEPDTYENYRKYPVSQSIWLTSAITRESQTRHQWQ
jgi:hypothetical protein